MTSVAATTSERLAEARRARPEPVKHTVVRRTCRGVGIDEIVLDPDMFGREPHKAVLHQVIKSQLAAARSGTQSTRTRAEVAGGGAKPFKQKGTGRARQGSIRAPQWIGGGIALGPKPRSYRQRTPKKMVRLALLSALSDRAALSKVIVIDSWDFEVPKTREAVEFLKALGVDGKVLVVLGPMDGIADRSFGNLAEIQTMQIAEINAYDVLRNDWIVFTDDTLPGETTTVPGSAETVQAATEKAEKEAAAAEKASAPKKAAAKKAAARKAAAAKKAAAEAVSDDDSDDAADEPETEVAEEPVVDSDSDDDELTDTGDGDES